MSLIDRYVHAVAEYLPKDIADDVARELRANIEDMLPENYTDEDAHRVLSKLGNPLKLANEYHPEKRYLIGPGYYDSYISALKLVVGICFAVFTGLALAGSFITPSEMDLVSSIANLITHVITEAFLGVVQGAFWVTLAYVFLERTGLEAGYPAIFRKKWTPDDLPEPANEHNSISRGATIFSMICTIVFTALLYLEPQLIALYYKDGNGALHMTTLFDANRLKGYMIFIIALAVYQFGLLTWMYISKRWHMPLVICSAINDFLACLLAVAMLADKRLFNAELVPAIARLTGGSKVVVAGWLDRGRMIIAVFFVVFALWDSLARYMKYQTGKKVVQG